MHPSLLPACSSLQSWYFLWTAVRANRLYICCFLECSQAVPSSSRGRFLWTAVLAHRSAYFMPPSLFPACSRGRVLWTRVQSHRFAYFYGLSSGSIHFVILWLPACLLPACNELPWSWVSFWDRIPGNLRPASGAVLTSIKLNLDNIGGGQRRRQPLNWQL